MAVAALPVEDPTNSTSTTIRSIATPTAKGDKKSATTYHQSLAQTEEEELHDTPLWLPEMSYRGNQYRYLQHQSNVIGYIKIKLIAAKNLSRNDYSLLSLGLGGRIGLGSGPEISPYIMFKLGSRSHSSSAVKNTSNPSWKKESFSIPLRKGDFPPERPVVLECDAKEQQTIVESLMPTTIKGDKVSERARTGRSGCRRNCRRRTTGWLRRPAQTPAQTTGPTLVLQSALFPPTTGSIPLPGPLRALLEATGSVRQARA